MYLYYLIVFKITTTALTFKVKTDQMRILIHPLKPRFLPTMGCTVAVILEIQATVQDHATIRFTYT